jgi:hypothetical protein
MMVHPTGSQPVAQHNTDCTFSQLLEVVQLAATIQSSHIQLHFGRRFVQLSTKSAVSTASHGRPTPSCPIVQQFTMLSESKPRASQGCKCRSVLWASCCPEAIHAAPRCTSPQHCTHCNPPLLWKRQSEDRNAPASNRGGNGERHTSAEAESCATLASRACLSERAVARSCSRASMRDATDAIVLPALLAGRWMVEEAAENTDVAAVLGRFASSRPSSIAHCTSTCRTHVVVMVASGEAAVRRRESTPGRERRPK